MTTTTACTFLVFKPLPLRKNGQFSAPRTAGNPWSSRLWYQIHSTRRKCASVTLSNSASASLNLSAPLRDVALVSLDLTKAAFTRTQIAVQTYPRYVQCGAAAVFISFAIWGLLPFVHYVRRNFFQRREWDKSQTKRMVTSYLRPLLLWTSVALLCRALDPVVLASETSQAIKERMLNFLRSLSTVLTFAFCTARLTQQIQRFTMERHTKEDARNLGIQFIGNAVSTSVWVAAVCLFMELLGFSTQKWLTAGGFGTVLLTLAGREIFTNFLSSVMIHATRPFVQHEWVQTKIDGQEVSGTVEHVGWWSPTIIRGEDREAVHIPNHKFTMSVVRNLTQKTHWRIKTHIGISHLDFGKINLIIADMRKVLAKHPQVEHRKLHRRVFFDTIDPANQSLMIIVSCFVKTSHYEEYLSVKEIILFNLLKVISHHNARLATPVRTIQRIYDEVETRQSPFRNGYGRPVLLVEATTSKSASESGDVTVEGETTKAEQALPSETSTLVAEAVEAKDDEKLQTELVERINEEVKQRVADAKKEVVSSTQLPVTADPREASDKDKKADPPTDRDVKAEPLLTTSKTNNQEVHDDPWKEPTGGVEAPSTSLSDPESFKENLVKSLHGTAAVLDKDTTSVAVATTD